MEDYSFETLAPNQIVAYNLKRARQMRGMTQEQVGDALKEVAGGGWSKANVSLAERSALGGRERNFTANDLVAFSQIFNLPIPWFFMPPPREAMGKAVAVGSAHPDRVLTPGNLIDALLTDPDGELKTRIEEVFEWLPAGWMSDSQQQIRGFFLNILESIFQHQSVGALYGWSDQLAEISDALRGLAGAVTKTDPSQWVQEQHESPKGSDPLVDLISHKPEEEKE